MERYTQVHTSSTDRRWKSPYKNSSETYSLWALQAWQLLLGEGVTSSLFPGPTGELSPGIPFGEHLSLLRMSRLVIPSF